MVTLQLCGTTVLPTMIRTRQILLLILTLKCSQTLAKILLIEEKDELHLAELFKESNQGQYTEYIVDHDQEDDFKQNSSFCEQLQLSGSIAAVVDLSWGGWFAAKQISLEKNIPYFRVEVSFRSYQPNFGIKKEFLFRCPMHLLFRRQIISSVKEMLWMQH